MIKMMAIATLLAWMNPTSATALPNSTGDLKEQSAICQRVVEAKGEATHDILRSYAIGAYDRIVLTRRCLFYLQGVIDALSDLQGSPYEPPVEDKQMSEQMVVCHKAFQTGFDAVTEFLRSKTDWSAEQQVSFAADCFIYGNGAVYEGKKVNKQYNENAARP
jgi:hypothetical protein